MGGEEMPIQVLDRLVARSITNGSWRGQFDRRQLARDLDELDAPIEIRQTLESLSAPTWEGFVRGAYHCLRGLEQALELPAMPSALDGLQPVRVIDEQVA